MTATPRTRLDLGPSRAPHRASSGAGGHLPDPRTSVRAPAPGQAGCRYDRLSTSWDLVFNMHADQPGRIRVGAQMDDGSYISGYLRHFSVDPEDTADRDLVLQAPLQLTTCAHEPLNLSYNYCILSARRFVRLDVQHLAPVEAAAEPREQAPAKMCLTSSRSGSNFGRRPSTRVGPEDHAG